MFLNPQKAIKEGWLRGISEEFIQPNAIDIPINELWKMKSNSTFYLFRNSKKHRQRTKVQPLNFIDSEQPVWILKTGVYDYFSKAYVEMPEGIVGWIVTRSTLNRNGVFIHSGLYDSGFKGHLNGSIYVLGGQAIIQPGSRIAQFIMAESDNAKIYTGGYNVNEGEYDEQLLNTLLNTKEL